MKFKTEKELEQESINFRQFCQKTIEDLGKKIKEEKLKNKAIRFLKKHPNIK